MDIGKVDMEVLWGGWKEGKMRKGGLGEGRIEEERLKGNEGGMGGLDEEVVGKDELMGEEFGSWFMRKKVREELGMIDRNGKMREEMNGGLGMRVMEVEEMGRNKLMVWGMGWGKDGGKLR